MAQQMAKIDLIGNIGKVEFFPAAGDKKALLAFGVAVNQDVEHNGAKVSQTMWENCVMSGNRATGLFNSGALRSGAYVNVVGTKHARVWNDKTTQELRCDWQLRVNEVVLLEKKSAGAETNAAPT